MTQTLLKNRYRVIRKLADGGFGETFLAEDTDTPSSRRCVIKQLKPVANNPQVYQLVQERFHREAAILEELGDGSNQIPTLYAYFVEGGQFYLVQEWIQGQTLTNKLQQAGLLSESSVNEILIGILPVLEYVHSKRIVHRDIKPENIILRLSDSKPVLIDFGAVKETMGTLVTASGKSSKSIVIGTPGFMPSEQSAGRPVFSSDLYSLGLTAIYLLTGKMPQELETEPLTGEILWRQHALNVSPSLAVVLDKSIQSYARERYSTAREMLEALQLVATPIPDTIVSAPPPRTNVQPQTEVSVPPPGGYTTPVPSPKPGMGDWQKAVVMGGVIGAFVMGGLWLTREQPTSPQPSPQQSPSPQDVQSPQPSPQQSPSPQDVQSPQPSPQQSPSPQDVQFDSVQPISQQTAVDLINQWQQSKQELFAPPFNRQLGAELTTGEAYRKNIGSNSSLEWLQNNNAYYRYGVQQIDSVKSFVASGERATIEVVVTEDRTLYKDGRINRDQTAFDTRLVRYSLQLDNGQLKISDYNTVRVISRR